MNATQTYQVQRRPARAMNDHRWEPVIDIDPEDAELAQTLYGREKRIHENLGDWDLRLVHVVEVVDVIFVN